jgi:hypothetical protein
VAGLVAVVAIGALVLSAIVKEPQSDTVQPVATEAPPRAGSVSAGQPAQPTLAPGAAQPNAAPTSAEPTTAPSLAAQPTPVPALATAAPSNGQSAVAPALGGAAPTVAPTPTVVPALAAAPATGPAAAAGTAASGAPTTIGPTGAAAVTTGATGTTPAAARALVDFTAAPNVRVNWPNNPDSTAWLEPDGYHLAARRTDQFVALNLPEVEPQRDVRVTATFRKLSGPSGGGYGIVLRDQSATPRDGLSQTGAFYVVEVGDRGQVGMWRRNGSEWVNLVDWTAAPAVRGAGDNTLVATIQGEKLTLTVNGVSVAEAADAVLATGRVGVFLGGDLNEALLTRLLVEPL